jgi:hypothetical protein
MKRITLLAVFALAFVGSTVAQSATEILERHIEAVGGKAAWDDVTDQYAKLSVSIELPQGVIVLDVELWTLYPGYSLTKQTAISVPDGFPDVSSVTYLTPEGGFAESMGDRQDFDADSVPSGPGTPSSNHPLEELDILARMDTMTVDVLDQEELSGKMVHVLSVDGSKRFYDVESGLLVAREAPMGPMGMVRMKISEYMDVEGGLKVPFIQEGSMEAGGQSMSQTMAMTSFEQNTGLTPAKLAEMAGVTADQ